MSDLPVPDLLKNKRSVSEILRVWIADGDLTLTLDPDSSMRPELWGLVLVEIAQHYAKAVAVEAEQNRSQVLNVVQRVFNAELEKLCKQDGTSKATCPTDSAALDSNRESAVTIEEAKEMWRAHFARVRQRRLHEAETIIRLSQAAGVTEDSLIVLRYCCVTTNADDAQSLSRKLSEDDEVTIQKTATPNEGWNVIGATEDEGFCITFDELTEWVKYIADVASAFGCSFASWEFHDAETGMTWKSSDVDTSHL
ncbi:MAG: DUF5076 domain-containing protein [Fuerstiella sp.]|jgi:hypothetical protein